MEKTIKKIVVIGAESTGKSTLCLKLAKHFNTTWVKEYARIYFENKPINTCTIFDIEEIAKQHVLNESILQANTNKFLFIDTNLITLKIWAELEFNTKINFIEEQLPNHKYDLVLLTKNTIPWQKDKLRENKFDRDLIFNLKKKHLINLNQKFIEIDALNFDEVLKNIISI